MSFPQDNEKTKKQFADLLNNKRVVVVGPAPHIIDYNGGSLIDSYDLVVRINHGYVVPEKNKKQLK